MISSKGRVPWIIRFVSSLDASEGAWVSSVEDASGRMPALHTFLTAVRAGALIDLRSKLVTTVWLLVLVRAIGVAVPYSAVGVAGVRVVLSSSSVLVVSVVSLGPLAPVQGSSQR
jgi:hypothetical protein